MRSSSEKHVTPGELSQDFMEDLRGRLFGPRLIMNADE
jgi:hypothetical protein